ncbi:MAG: hypothetical protein ABIT38_10115, partial [Gemmatimonadaceae bacterium]
MRSPVHTLAVALLGALAATAPRIIAAQKADTTTTSAGGAMATIVRDRDSSASSAQAPKIAGTPRAPLQDSLTLGGRVIKAGERVEGP